MDQRNFIMFSEKMNLNVKGHRNVDCGVNPVYYEQYTSGITTFEEGREDVNDDARPFRPSVESLLERLLMMLIYRSAHAKQFLWTFYA